MKLLPFHYYPFPGARPVVCELDQDGYVYMSHSDSVIHRSKYTGQFVPLIEFHSADAPVSKGEGGQHAEIRGIGKPQGRTDN
jgi:hypothetical protein